MIFVANDSDALLRGRLAKLSGLNKDYWSFTRNCTRESGHGLFQYPAMMVPQMVRAVLREIRAVHPEVARVLDPFVGSGTILTEAMLGGLGFVGRDINPLAILLCRTKTGPFRPRGLARASTRLLSRTRADRGLSSAARFKGLGKWFRRGVQVSLSRIARAIRQERSPAYRRFFWVALAETVRITSNSRTSTFKLHIRSQEDLRQRRVDPILTFERILKDNVAEISTLRLALEQAKLLRGARYRMPVRTVLGSSTLPLPKSVGKADVLITSPPYGDNTSTVPYGQFSFLPLQWIDLSDIDPKADSAYIRTTHEIDSRSLGGRRRLGRAEVSKIAKAAPSLKRFLKRIELEPPDRTTRVAAYFRDLRESVACALSGLRAGAVMVWVLGNRRVGGHKVPLDRVLREMLEASGATWVTTLRRRIHSKRIASQNSVAKTMSAERVLVMRVGACNSVAS